MTPGTLHSLVLAGALFAPSLLVAAAGGMPKGIADATRVRGRVTYNGEPMKDAAIVFYMAGRSTGDIASVPMKADGSFALRLPRGRHEIFILPISRSRRTGAIGRPRPEARETMPTLASDREPQIPKRFRYPTTSQLAVTIGDRAYRIDIELQD